MLVWGSVMFCEDFVCLFGWLVLLLLLFFLESRDERKLGGYRGSFWEELEDRKT